MVLLQQSMLFIYTLTSSQTFCRRRNIVAVTCCFPVAEIIVIGPVTSGCHLLVTGLSQALSLLVTILHHMTLCLSEVHDLQENGFCVTTINS